MTSANISSDTCAFPGCQRPRRPREGDGGGKPPVYCDLINPSTGKYAHTSLTASREQARLDRAGAAAQSLLPSPTAILASEAPATAARGRGQSLLDQFRSEAGKMAGTLQAAIEAMTSASDPNNVAHELTAARRQVERSTMEIAEHREAAESAQAEADEAKTARDEAIAELEAAEGTVGVLRKELQELRAGHAAELDRIRAEHADELQGARDEAEQQVAAAQTDAAGKIEAAWAEAAGKVEAAEQQAADQVEAAEFARDQALAEASAARQAATDATRRADDTREELRGARTEHRDELAELRKEHRDELVAERQRADTALEALRTEHRREVETLQQALTALREQRRPGPAPEDSSDQRKKR